MGREKKILLGILGLLAGVFLGALSVKLLVPRPPAGTGPDIRSHAAVTTAQERVEPPSPAPRSTPASWDFAAAPPLVPDALTDRPDPAPDTDAVLDESSRFNRFPAAPSAEPAAEPPPDTDAGVTPVAWQRAAAPTAPPLEAAGSAHVPHAIPRVDATDPRGAGRFDTSRAPPVAGAYLVQAGDSWWGVAERAYGDGRLYRALFAWNRSRDPRISLAPGTRLDVPPLTRLAAAWPRLLPATDDTSRP